ncbi:hypothetical protein L915_00233, partial [Phytophthora nicotianae]
MRDAYSAAILNAIGSVPAISIIKYTRSQISGSDPLRDIESTPTRSVAQDDPRPFLQSVLSVLMGVDNAIVLNLDIRISYGCCATL